MKLGFVGAGEMASAIIKSIHSDFEIFVSDISAERLEKLEKEFGATACKDNKELSASADVVVLAVRPQHIDSVLEEIKDSVSGKLVISIAAAVTLSHIEKFLKNAKIARVMSTLTIGVNAGMTAYALNGKCTEQDASIVESVFSKGKIIQIEEEKIDAYTAISLPAFCSEIVSIFSELAKEKGFSAEEAELIAAQSAFGSAKYLLETGEAANDFSKKVATKGGVTEAGLNALDTEKIKSELRKALDAAIKRAKRMSKNE